VNICVIPWPFFKLNHKCTKSTKFFPWCTLRLDGYLRPITVKEKSPLSKLSKEDLQTVKKSLTLLNKVFAKV